MKLLSLLTLIVSFTILLPTVAFSSANILPGSIDASRILKEDSKEIATTKKTSDFEIPISSPKLNIPESAKKIKITVKQIFVEGVTAFKKAEIFSIYSKTLNKEVPLSIIWEIADDITKKYRENGYFLSRAYLPEQSIKEGKITIKVVEGYISKVNIPDNLGNNKIIKPYLNQILTEKPINARTVENVVLKLNDIPGLAFRAVISKPKDKNNLDDQVELDLIPSKSLSSGVIGIDNYTSRYAGPQESIVSISTSLLPFQQTTLSGLVGIPINRLTFESVDHYAIIAPNTKLGFNFSATYTHPRYNIKQYDLKSSANTSNIYTEYQWIRQRHINLSSKISFSSINVATDILGHTLVRDHIRVIRSGLDFSCNDKWLGSNQAELILSRGIDGLGSSSNDNIYASRSGAKPAFSKAEASYSRLQELSNNWLIYSNTSAQIASKTLYSYEQFGYGGQTFGRAYDGSEITGDQGLETSLELRYKGFNYKEKINVQTFTFYDVGKIWNHSSSAVDHQSAASAGFGFRVNTPLKQYIEVGLAWPLSKQVSTPIYGADTKDPRIFLKFNQMF